MQNETRFEDICAIIIDPIKRHWGGDFEPETISEFVDELGHYPNHLLKSGMKKVIREQKHRPRLATIIEACERDIPLAKPQDTGKDTRFHLYDKAEYAHKSVAKQILASPAGKLAMQLGVGFSLMVEYEKTGRRDYNEAFVRKQKTALDECAVLVNEAFKIKNPQAEAYRGLLDAMTWREKNLEAMMK